MENTVFSGATTYSAMAPGWSTPTARQFRQKFCRFSRQAGQLSQAMFGSTATRSPTSNRVTSEPIAVMTPANSCPGIIG